MGTPGHRRSTATTAPSRAQLARLGHRQQRRPHHRLCRQQQHRRRPRRRAIAGPASGAAVLDCRRRRRPPPGQGLTRPPDHRRPCRWPLRACCSPLPKAGSWPQSVAARSPEAVRPDPDPDEERPPPQLGPPWRQDLWPSPWLSPPAACWAALTLTLQACRCQAHQLDQRPALLTGCRRCQTAPMRHLRRGQPPQKTAPAPAQYRRVSGSSCAGQQHLIWHSGVMQSPER